MATAVNCLKTKSSSTNQNFKEKKKIGQNKTSGDSAKLSLNLVTSLSVT